MSEERPVIPSCAPPPSSPGVQVPAPQLAVLDDDRFVIELIARVTGRPAREVRQRLVVEHESLGTNVRQAMDDWHLPRYQWSDRLVSFYEQTDAFMYETCTWNRCHGKQQMRQWIAEFLRATYPDGARVLSYGDGMGFDSLYLAQAGHDVTSFEVSHRGRHFASAIFERAGVHVHTVERPEDLQPESFDAVVCLDVLEHVPNPPQCVGEIAGLLKEGGHLLVHSPFFYLAPAVGTHLRSNRRYSGSRRMFATHQLFPVAGELFWNPLALRKGCAASREAVPFAVHLGGWLLSAARLWHAPHVFACEQLLTRADRRDLARRVDGLMALTFPGKPR